MNGERVLTNVTADESLQYVNVPKPLAMKGRSVGGAGVVGSTGLCTIGLLVRMAGRITAFDPSSTPHWFKIDDGSGAVKCLAPNNVSINKLWVRATVTGACSCEMSSGQRQRLIRLRGQGDIQAF